MKLNQTTIKGVTENAHEIAMLMDDYQLEETIVALVAELLLRTRRRMRWKDERQH